MGQLFWAIVFFIGAIITLIRTGKDLWIVTINSDLWKVIIDTLGQGGG